MTRVAVVHRDLMAKGGGEAVAVNVVSAVQDAGYEVLLITLTKPDIGELEQYYDVNIKKADVEMICPPARFLHGKNWADRLGLLKSSLMSRCVDRHVTDQDLLINTSANELFLKEDCIQYVHYPGFWDARRSSNGPVSELYRWGTRRIAGASKSRLQSDTLLTNSNWTAGIVKQSYRVSPQVLYPPVSTGEFDSQIPWDQRKDRFVSICRISRNKKILRNIEIIRRVKQRGNDVQYAIVGPANDTEYRQQIESACAESEFVNYLGELSRADLVRLLTESKYGIHGRDHEHFGIAVAEMRAAGMLPFVPRGGGQREVVDCHSELLYRNVPEAVELIDGVLNNPSRQLSIRSELSSPGQKFGREQFRDGIQKRVDECVT